MVTTRHPPDLALLSATRSGDPEAFGTFYLRHRDAVMRFCGARVGSPEAVLDLVAETFAAALEAVHGDRPPQVENAPGWLLGIARHKIADTYRRGAVDDRARRRIGLERLAPTADDVERILALADEGDAVKIAASLPAEQREAVYGRIVAERTYEELARELQVPASTVRKRVSRALTTLRSRMTEDHA